MTNNNQISNLNFLESSSINEFFSIPRKLQKRVVAGNVTVFTSEALSMKIREVMFKNMKTLPVANELSSMIKKESVIPCYMVKNIVKALARKIIPLYSIISSIHLNQLQISKSFGWYSKGDNKIVLIIDNNSRFIAFVNDNEFVDTLIHEVMHMAAFNDNAFFWSTFKPLIEKFYFTFYNILFKFKKEKINEAIKLCDSWALYLYQTFETNKVTSGKSVIKHISEFIEELKKLSSLKDKKLKENSIILKAAFMNIGRYYILARHFQLLTDTYRKTYGKLFSKESKSFPFQELVIPSEIVAVGSEISGSMTNYYKIIKSLSKKM